MGIVSDDGHAQRAWTSSALILLVTPCVQWSLSFLPTNLSPCSLSP
jgi:hypothetical protein